MVTQSCEARARATTGIGFALAAPVFSAANPVAGIVVQALGLLADAAIAIGGAAVGGWRCPEPLTIRSATGDCDFSQLLGTDAQANVARQREGIERYYGGGATSDEQRTDNPSSDAWQKPALIAGGVALAAAAAYLLLED